MVAQNRKHFWEGSLSATRTGARAPMRGPPQSLSCCGGRCVKRRAHRERTQC
jgi:hypothetical protein